MNLKCKYLAYSNYQDTIERHVKLKLSQKIVNIYMLCMVRMYHYSSNTDIHEYVLHFLYYMYIPEVEILTVIEYGLKSY